MSGGPSQQLLSELASRPGGNSWADKLIRWVFISLSVMFLAALLISPLMIVLTSAFAKGASIFEKHVGLKNNDKNYELNLINPFIN